MVKKKVKQEKSIEDIKAEIKKLSDRADKTTSKQPDLFLAGEIGEEDADIIFDSSILNDTADPVKSYRLYYGIRRLLMDYLPKGKNNKELRDKIYSEKNLFLNRGIEINQWGIRGSDSRMTYITNFLEVAFNTVTKWIITGGTPYDIWQSFWDLNEERGYHNQQQELSGFDKNLKSMLKVPPPPKGKDNI